MSDLVWWTLFAILTLLLIVFTVRLCHRVLCDVFCSEESIDYKESETSRDFNPSTRFSTDSRTIFKEIQFKDETDKGSMKNLLVNNHKSRIEEIDETNQMAASNEAIYGGDDVENEIEEEEEECEDLTEEEKQILEKIQGIKGEVDIYAKKVPYCLGGKQHLQYLELDQNFLMNAINLNSIDCNNNEKLKKRKQMVSIYIQECQTELKKKAEEDIL